MSQIKTKFITDSAVTTAKIADSNVTSAKIQSDVALAGNPTTTTQSPNDNSTRISTTAYVDAAVSAFQNGFSWQQSAIDYITDNTVAPPTEVSGDRYILSHDGGAPNAAYDGASAGDIVEFDGTSWQATTPTTAYAIIAEDELDGIYIFGGASWSKKGFEATTGGAGTTLNVNAIDVNVDDVGIEINGSDNLQLKDGGVGTAKLADDAVTAAKLNADTAGLGLTQAAGGELDVNVDDVGIEIATDTVQLKDGGVTEAKLNSGVDAQTFDATHTAVNYTPTQVGTEGTTKISAHLSGIDSALGALTSTTPNKESFTLAAGDITNQYIDLANVALASSISFLPVGGPEQQEGVDYTVSLTGGAGGNTRITFAGELATAGAAALEAGDVIVIKYDYEA